MNVLRHIFLEPWGREMHSAKRCLFRQDLPGAFFKRYPFKSRGTLKQLLNGSMVLLLLVDILLEVGSSPLKSHHLVSHCCSKPLSFLPLFSNPPIRLSSDTLNNNYTTKKNWNIILNIDVLLRLQSLSITNEVATNICQKKQIVKQHR